MGSVVRQDTRVGIRQTPRVTATPLPLAAVVELPPEISGALTFHLPLEVFALQAAGADPAVIDARIADRLAEAYRDGLVDPPLYRWAVEHHRDVARRLLDPSPTVRDAAFRSVLPLGDGLAGAAFHGLIRLGYALWRGDPEEVARGLAYLRTRRQVLAGAVTGRADDPDDGGAMPPHDQRAGATVFDLLNLAAGAGGHDDLIDPGVGLPSPRSMAARAADLVRHDASSFVAIHAVTGLHGLVEVHRSVTGAAPDDDISDSVVAPWWRAYAAALRACSLVVAGTPTTGTPECTETFTDLGALTRAAIDSGDTHSVKLVVALRRLAELGVVETATVFDLGARKLAVDECGA